MYISSLSEAFGKNEMCMYPGPPCTPPGCFIGSYAPVTPSGQVGPFWVNSYALRPDRQREFTGGRIVRVESDLRCDKK